MSRIDFYLKTMTENRASDIHLLSSHKPAIRVSGDIQYIENETLDEKKLRPMLYEIIEKEKLEEFEKTGDIDFGYEIPGLQRYRVNFFLHKDGIGAVFREIPHKIDGVKELGLPAIISDLASLPRGLVLITGPTGSGKSTTMAAIIDHANNTRTDHIITIEDPIEFVHKSKKAIVTHREVGMHTKSYATALKAALREDPDIILIGEMRDVETISLALEAASTGHLVMSTLHTKSAAETVDRIIQVFPSENQPQIRAVFAESIAAVASQVLLKRKDGKGRCAALEILMGTSGVKNLIREGKTHQIASMIQTGKKYGMQLLDDAIMDLEKKSIVDISEAKSKMNKPNNTI